MINIACYICVFILIRNQQAAGSNPATSSKSKGPVLTHLPAFLRGFCFV